jgi:hypothetical protein
MSIAQTTINRISNLQAPYTVVTDWKNQQTFQGDIYTIVFDCSPTLQKFFTLIYPLVGYGIPIWMLPYWRNSKGWLTAFSNQLLNYSSSIGVLKNKIRILDEGTGFKSNYEHLHISFQVIENSWPIYAVVAAILAICGLLTVREVRLMKKGPVAGPSFLGLPWYLVVPIAVLVAINILPDFTE